MDRVTIVIACSLLFIVGSCQTAVSAKREKKTIYSHKSNQRVDTHDVDSPQGAALEKQVGKRISFTGKFIGWRTGRPGLHDEKTQTEISFETIPIPQKRELTLKYAVTRHRENPNRITITVINTGGEWYSETSSPKREQKLRNLLKSTNENDAITATGKLCHLKVISAGDYNLFPQIPSSCFFFSVDDLAITPVSGPGN